VLRGGARLAEPGEFTQRAFLAGRIDLTQAEAVNDLIGSVTLQAGEGCRVAEGARALAKTVAPVKAELVDMIAEMEAWHRLAEDDIDVMAAERIAQKIAEVRAPLVALERSFAYAAWCARDFGWPSWGGPTRASRASSTVLWSASGRL